MALCPLFNESSRMAPNLTVPLDHFTTNETFMIVNIELGKLVSRIITILRHPNQKLNTEPRLTVVNVFGQVN